MSKKVLILSYSNLNSDPRILRQVMALKNDFTLITAGYSPIKDASINHFNIYTEPPFSLPRKLKRLFQFISRSYDNYYWDNGKKNILSILQKEKPDAIIANDIQTLPLALAIAGNSPIVYFDAHEFHPREFEENLKWRILERPYVSFLCKKYIPNAARFSTVCNGIADEYKKFVGVLPEVVTNAASYEELTPSKTKSSEIKLIHHGAAIEGRKLEQMIEMMNFLDEKFSLTFMLTSNNATYLEDLKRMAGDNNRISFIPAVPHNHICSTINKFDIGVYLLQPTNFNNLNALPNKFFEYVQARLCIAISPSPEMAKLVKNYKLGVIADDYTPQSLAEKINSLSDNDINNFKAHVHEKSKILSAEVNLKKVSSIIQEITG
jgi:glycosyltransferase involved in cell wall biosynthesis